MATRKTSTQKIDPVAVAAHAMCQVKTKSDYTRIVAANTKADIEAAWARLSRLVQERIINICNDSPQTDINAIASEIIACGTYLELQAVKASHSADVVKSAWKLIPVSERNRIKALCEQPPSEDSSEIPNTYPENVAKVDAWLREEGLIEQQQVEESSPVTEQPTTYRVEQPQPKARTLFSISDDLEKLNDLLDDCGDDAEQQELISQWFEQLGDERDRKLDGYAALITEMSARAEVRKAEAKRLQELAAVDENRAKLLKDRLKLFFQTHNLKTIDTARYRLSVAKNGGKQPLILDEAVPVTQLPERFQKVSIDPDTAAIRDALERGEKLGFAQLGERGTSLRIK